MNFWADSLPTSLLNISILLGQLLNLSALQSLMASQKKSLPFQNLLQQHRGPTQVAMVQITQIFCSSSSSSSSKCRASCNSWVLLLSLPWEASQA